MLGPPHVPLHSRGSRPRRPMTRGERWAVGLFIAVLATIIVLVLWLAPGR